jgi:hypothetical protein
LALLSNRSTCLIAYLDLSSIAAAKPTPTGRAEMAQGFPSDPIERACEAVQGWVWVTRSQRAIPDERHEPHDEPLSPASMPV